MDKQKRQLRTWPAAAAAGPQQERDNMARRLLEASPDADLAGPGQPSPHSPGAARIALGDDEESVH